MKNGYIIQLDSNTFEGCKCYIALLGLNISQGHPAKWGRILDSKWAHVFASESDAEEVLSKLLCSESFVAPEVNRDLALRLGNASIIKIDIQKIE
jgi:hypothetical protein